MIDSCAGDCIAGGVIIDTLTGGDGKDAILNSFDGGVILGGAITEVSKSLGSNFIVDGLGIDARHLEL
jgi:hypothetical protein